MTRPALATSVVLSAVLATTLMGAGVLSGQTPPQPLFDWDTPPFPAEDYQERRARLAEEAAQAGGAFVVLSGAGLSHGDTFRQLDDFSYLVGLELPRSLLIVDGTTARSVLFVPAGDFRFESPSRPNDFPGRPLSTDPEILAWLSDVEVRDAAEADQFVDSLASIGTPLIVNPGSAQLPTGPGPLFASEEEVVQSIRSAQARWSDARFVSGFDAMARVRSIKSANEIEIMERVARMTARAIVRSVRDVSEGTTERTLEGAFLEACKSDGSQRAAFAPIIKSGPNSLWPWRVLASHYDRRDRAMTSGDLVIFDVGCELDGYISDVGRTFPVNGQFTQQQRQILDMEVDVSDAIIAAIKPGVTLAELQAIADRAIPENEKPYMQVGLFFGHHLGLSTGDPVLTDEPLKAGMIFTVEPWYYNHDLDVSVFTEDQILVTSQGARNLTADLPRRPDALEAVVASGVVSRLTLDPGDAALAETLAETVDNYAATWNEADPDQRLAALGEVWASNGRYRDPTAHVRGRNGLSNHIAGFQSQLPGSTIRRSGPVLGTAAHFYFRWEIVDASGQAVATGHDAGVLDVDGRILEIRGFFDQP
ncbi:MAG: aminopeptidase P N-terminal domain-containing protein [Longimicrobiales bacterium]